MEQSSASTQQDAQCNPARRDPRPRGPSVLEANRKNVGAYFGVKPLSMSLKAPGFGLLPRGSPSTAIEVGEKQQRSTPAPKCTFFCWSRALLLPGALGGAGIMQDSCNPCKCWGEERGIQGAARLQLAAAAFLRGGGECPPSTPKFPPPQVRTCRWLGSPRHRGAWKRPTHVLMTWPRSYLSVTSDGWL